MAMAQQLDRFLGALTAQNAQATRWLRPGRVEDSAFQPFEEIRLAPDLRQLWARFDGQEVPEGSLLEQTWLDGMFCYLGIEEAAEDYRSNLALWAQDPEYQSYWPKGIVPIGTPGDGSRLLVDCGAGSDSHGAVFELFHGMGVSRISASLARYVETLNACLNEGAIRVEHSGEVTIDFDAFHRIGKAYNPGCDRFD